MTEAAIKRRIMREAAKVPGLLLRMRPPGSMSGDPDIYGSYHGKHLELEAKRPGCHARPLQLKRLRDWQAAGAVAEVVRSWEDVQAILRRIDGE